MKVLFQTSKTQTAILFFLNILDSYLNKKRIDFKTIDTVCHRSKNFRTRTVTERVLLSYQSVITGCNQLLTLYSNQPILDLTVILLKYKKQILFKSVQLA